MLFQYKTKFAEILSWEISDLSISEIIDLIQLAPANIQWDLAFPCFSLSKQMQKAPNIIANEAVEKIGNPNIIAVWPYINCIIENKVLANDVISQIQKQWDDFWKWDNKNETILVESPWPNTNKPLHLWHVRNLLLWNSIVDILNFAGYDAKRIDIINDRGIHICKSMLAYKLFGNNAEPNKKSDHFVWDWYVEYAVQEEKDPSLLEQAQDMLVKWENWDSETMAIWGKMNKRAIDGMQETYQRYWAVIDKAYRESEHYLNWKDIIEKWLEKNVFHKNDKGNICFSNEEKKIENKVVLRADGTSVYLTQDIALAQKRFEDYNMDQMIYIVWNEQEDHFKALFEIFKALEFKFANNCFHMSYGMISIPGGKMKSREWKVIDADNLADEMRDESMKILAERYPDLEQNELTQRAETIWMAAIKFFILKYDVNKNFVFDPAESLSFEWETGPYLLYTYARACSIIRNAKKEISNIDFTKLDTQEDKNLLLHLAQFEKNILLAAQEQKPNIVARYCLDLVKLFNNYYQKHKILTDDEQLSNARISLVNAVKQTLGNWLKLLGINLLEQM